MWEEDDDLNRTGVHTHKHRIASCGCNLVMFVELRITHNCRSYSPSFG